MAGPVLQAPQQPIEVRGGVELPSYYGDAVNAIPFDPGARRPGPDAAAAGLPLLSAALNLVRAFTQDGSADLRQVHAWNRDFVRETPAGQRVRRHGRRDRPGAGVHEGLRRRPRGVPQCRVLRGARGAVAGLRAGADPHRLAHRARCTTCPGTSCGSVSAPASPTAPTSTSRPRSPTRSGSSSARRPPLTMSWT